MHGREGCTEETSSVRKKISVFTIFEEYWVLGKSIGKIEEEYGVNFGFHMEKLYGIPTRNQQDAQNLRVGKCSIPELWGDYLSPFQLQLARELRTMRLGERKRRILEEE